MGKGSAVILTVGMSLATCLLVAGGYFAQRPWLVQTSDGGWIACESFGFWFAAVIVSLATFKLAAVADE